MTMSLQLDYASDVLRRVSETSEVHTTILGAGWSTETLLWHSDPDLRRGIRVILDDDPQRWNTHIAGIPVRAPDDYPLGDIRRVIITSEMFQPELMTRAAQLFDREVEILYTFNHEQSLPAHLNEASSMIEQRWDEPHPDDTLWYSADRLLTTLRQHLGALPTWRYGPRRQVAEFTEIRKALEGLVAWPGCSFLNFGCGRYCPLGVSLLALLSGARQTVASDLEGTLDDIRAARAMVDLIECVLMQPRLALGPDAPTRADLIGRIESLIDLEALCRGHLLPAVKSEALAHRVESIYETTLPAEAFDVIASRDVFEHLPDVPRALGALYRRLKRKGLLLLFIDFSDHRRYQDPLRFSHWSHLMDLEAPTHLGTNRLRFGQYPVMFDGAGFETLHYRPQTAEALPSDARAALAPIYQKMSDEDLAVSRAVAVLRRPVADRRTPSTTTTVCQAR